MLVIRIVAGVAALLAALFLPAGRLDWPAAWAFLFFFFASLLLLRAWLVRRNPALLEERLRVAPNVESWDKIVMAIHTVLLFTLLALTALDAGRLRWSSIPVGVRIAAWVGLALALAVVAWVMSVNPFASRWVRIQHDRGHRVISSGPYRRVRHPMYVGVILNLLCLLLALGSWWGVAPGLACSTLFIIRTMLEDRALASRLPGYREYASRVRYRLLPGVW